MKNKLVFILSLIFLSAVAASGRSFAQSPANTTPTPPPASLEPVVPNFIEKALGTTGNPTVKKKISTIPADNNFKYWESGSMMFEVEKIIWIREALKAFERNIPISILLPNLFPPELSQEEGESVADANKSLITDVLAGLKIEEETISEPLTEAPVFYLKSIMYFSPKEWTLWLGNQKISYGERSPFVDVIQVTEKSATFLWRSARLNEIQPEWGAQFISFDEDDKFVSNNKNIVIDTDSGNVSFILGINQSLDSKSMKIIEGKANPIPILQQTTETTETIDGENPEQQQNTSIVEQDSLREQILGGHNPADGVKALYTSVDQLNQLKSILEENAGSLSSKPSK